MNFKRKYNKQRYIDYLLETREDYLEHYNINGNDLSIEELKELPTNQQFQKIEKDKDNNK